MRGRFRGRSLREKEVIMMFVGEREVVCSLERLWL